jgi:Protein of unknown function (DUF1186)/SEC-C motif
LHEDEMTDIAIERTRLSIPEILKALEFHTGRFPKRAVQEAIEQREATTPGLLRVLQEVAEDPAVVAERDDYMLHLYAMYLLAQFREKRAYRLLVRIFSAPGDTPDELAGDTITERLAEMFCSVYDGDPEPLKRLVEDDNVYAYVRSAALDAFILLVNSGQMPREEAVGYYRALFEGKLTREPNHVWNMLAYNVGDFPAPELMDQVRRAYAEGLVETGFARLEDIEADLNAPERRKDRRAVITDAIAEMEWWPSFQPKPVSKTLPSPLASKLSRPLPAASPAAPRVKVGRNDLCPCRRGKKFKKCCGGN